MPPRSSGWPAISSRCASTRCCRASQPGEIRAALPAAPPEEAEPFEAVLADLDRVLLPGLTHWQSPRYFAYFAVDGLGAGDPGRAAGRGTEPGGDPLAHLARAAGAGGGDARLAAPAARAAARACRPHRGLGVHGDAGSPCRRAGSGSGAARRRRLGARALVDRQGLPAARARAAQGAGRRRIPAARRHARPAGRVCGRGDDRDDLDQLGRPGPGGRRCVCRRHGVWLHVDAAYAGTAAVCPELRDRFAGWERADSIVVNPHKWMATPMDCSALWTRRVEDFRNAFSLVPEYLRSPDDALNLSEVSVPLGRRFRALKLWAVLRCYGRAGLQAHIREHCRLAQLFAGWVRDEPGWEVCAPTPFSLVCFRLGADGRGERGAAGAGQRVGRGVSLACAPPRPLRVAPRNRQLPHHRGRCAPRLGCPPARGDRTLGPDDPPVGDLRAEGAPVPGRAGVRNGDDPAGLQRDRPGDTPSGRPGVARAAASRGRRRTPSPSPRRG